MARPGKKKKVLFILEIVVLLLFIGGLYVYGQISAKLDKIEQPEFKQEEVSINPEVQEKEMTGYTTYALFGIDHRDNNASLEGENSDTIIIASVNNDTKDVKMVSVYRDTIMNIGDDTYSKANSAYAYGGPEQAISMLNTNLDLNITDYATVDFNAMVTAIDCLGGLDVPMSYAEIEHMNNYCVETSEETGKSYTPIEKPDPAPADQEAIIGTYHLNGVQATSYCRIRYTASLDMGRTERQRMIIQMMVSKAKTAGLATIFSIMDEVFPMVKTSVSKTEILQLIPAMIGYGLDDTTGFPKSYKFSNIKGSIIVPTSLETNVVELHKFLYGDDVVYTPSSQVVATSDKIMEIVGGEEQLEDASTATEATEGTTADTFVWTDPAASTDTTTDNYSSDTTYDSSSDNTDYSGDTGGGGYDYEPDYSEDTGGGDYSDGTGGDYSGDPGDTGGDYSGDTGDTGDTGSDYSEDTGGGDGVSPESSEGNLEDSQTE